MSNLRNQLKSGELHKAGGAAAASDAEHLSPPDLLSSSPKIFASNARNMAEGSNTDIIRQILVKKIKDRGAVEGLVDLSTGDDKASKFLQLACVVHETPDKVVDFFLSESKEGKFRRHIVHEEYNGEGDYDLRRISYWQHFNARAKFVEYLLDMRVKSNGTDAAKSYTIDINSMDEDDDDNNLPQEAVSKLAEILGMTKSAKRGKISKGQMTASE
ncbi:hypothetical protein TrCOL_g4500, partial [Triparma columacea]